LVLTVISPLGVRTATASAAGERIITPSITACPPTLTDLDVMIRSNHIFSGIVQRGQLHQSTFCFFPV
jgi:hypothetical protein